MSVFREVKVFLSFEFARFSSTALIIVSYKPDCVSRSLFLEISVRIQLTARFSVLFEIQTFYLRGIPFHQLGSLLLVSSAEPKFYNFPTRSSQLCSSRSILEAKIRIPGEIIYRATSRQLIYKPTINLQADI